MPGFRFDIDTAGRVVDDRTVRVTLNADWNVDGRILNGGYLQAVAVRATADLLGAPGEPIAVSTSFAAPATPGAAEVTVAVLRRGRRLCAASATLSQDSTTVLACLVTFAELPSGSAAPTGPGAPPGSAAPPFPTAPTVPAGPVPAGLTSEWSGPPSTALAMPDVTGPAESIRVPPERLPGPPGLVRVLDLAFVPEDSGWLSGDTSAGPRIRCWLSFADRRPLDALALVAMADMAPPVSFAQGRFGWAPTLQLQVGVFARPFGEHLLLDLRGEPYDGSFVAEDGLLWDASGNLVARSRQIAIPPRG
jgi:hypothetical protein